MPDKSSESPVSHERPGGGAGVGEGGGKGVEGHRERAPVALQEVISAPSTAALSWPPEEHPAEGKGADHDHRFPGRQRPAPAPHYGTLALAIHERGAAEIKCKSHETPTARGKSRCIINQVSKWV